METQEI